MPRVGVVENLKFLLRVGLADAELLFVWIDSVHSETPEGPEALDLHERLTVIASADAARRLKPFRQVHASLHVAPATTVEVRTEYGDRITAQRGADGTAALYETVSKLPIRGDDPGVGLVSQLNSQAEMAQHLSLFHVTAERLRARVSSDADLIALSRTPLDQLFTLASQITADEAALTQTRTRRSDLSQRMDEREEREQNITEQVNETNEGNRKIHFLTLALFAVIAAGIAVAVLVSSTIGLAICAGALIISGLGYLFSKRLNSGDDITGEATDVQLGRVNELFDTHDLTQNRRQAEGSLAENVAQWKAIAGNIKPSALVNDRTRIEELASHLRLIDNENVAPADTSILIGFASLLAELSRRFPAERVPMLVDDLFTSVAPQYHAVLRDLILRASHRRQVILETGDLNVAKWAAVEAVGGNALLISDFDIDVEPIINQAVAAHEQQSV